MRDEPAPQRAATAAMPASVAMPVLETRDLHAWYGESHVLHGMNLEVRPGELVTLLGRNGAGKTTTLKAIMGMVARRTGSVRFASHGASGASLELIELIGLPSNQNRAAWESSMQILPGWRRTGVGEIDELKIVSERDGALRIGAGASLTDAYGASHGTIPESNEMWERFASPPIRNAGTMGGNVANGSPIGDSMPGLIALGAT